MGFCLGPQEMNLNCRKFLNRGTLNQNSALYMCVYGWGACAIKHKWHTLLTKCVCMSWQYTATLWDGGCNSQNLMIDVLPHLPNSPDLAHIDEHLLDLSGHHWAESAVVLKKRYRIDCTAHENHSHNCGLHESLPNVYCEGRWLLNDVCYLYRTVTWNSLNKTYFLINSKWIVLKYISRCHIVLVSSLKWKKLISCTLHKHGIIAVVIFGIWIRLSDMFLHVVFSIIMEEYEKTISRLVAEKEQERQAYEQEKSTLLKDRDAAMGHLANIEIAFSDLHK